MYVCSLNLNIKESKTEEKSFKIIAQHCKTLFLLTRKREREREREKSKHCQTESHGANLNMNK